MSVNLNEFTVEQLKFAIELFTDSQDNLNYKLQCLEDFQQGDVRHDLEIVYNKSLDIAILWRVQCENAIREVKKREEINSN